MNLQKYIPRDKRDLETARAAVEAGYDFLKPVIPQMLKWHQDYNWPVAHVITSLYKDADEDIVPHLEKILESDDWSWKYWIIADIIPQISKPAASHFAPELHRLAESPSEEEKHNELNEVAQSTLETLMEKWGRSEPSPPVAFGFYSTRERENVDCQKSGDAP